jgi:phage-related minor tail protein
VQIPVVDIKLDASGVSSGAKEVATAFNKVVTEFEKTEKRTLETENALAEISVLKLRWLRRLSR